MRIVNVAGYTNSGEDHWQTHLEKQYRDFSRVQQDDWFLVEKDPWLGRLTEHIQASKEDTVLVGHSCGSIASAQWLAQRYDPRVKAAILVAPADVESPPCTRSNPCARHNSGIHTARAHGPCGKHE